MVLLITRKERQHYEAVRNKLFESEKSDVYIYEFEGKYVVSLICAIQNSEFIYQSLLELLVDAEARDFFGPMEMTKTDYEKIAQLKAQCLQM